MVLCIYYRQWRFTEITIKLLVMLIRRDVPFPFNAMRLLVMNLISDSLAIRKVSKLFKHACTCTVYRSLHRDFSVFF